jgi:2,3,4,5-tetrahydropyridine-2-carboxylate N-succinyltransferase
VIAAGTILTKSTPLFDLVNQQVIRPVDGVLHVPENAVVIPGARAIDTDFARSMGLSAYAPIIVKYRDDKTDASIELVDLFRQK